jgi:hypothetical protein
MQVPSALALAAALALAGCGGDDHAGGDNGQPTRWAKQPLQPQNDPHAPRNVIVFRRVRYEGATLRTLYLHRDGTIDIEVPGGGTGAARFDGSVTDETLRDVKTLVRRVDWNHLSPKKVELDGSGAYYMLRHGGKEHVAMASGMSVDLVPVVKRLNGILNGDGRRTHRALHRFNIS